MATDFKQAVKSGLFWLGLFKVIGQAFIWISTILIARFLEPADYGLMGMATLITSFVVLIGDFGLGFSIVQKKELEPVHVHSLFWISAAMGLGFFLVLYILSPLAGKFFENDQVIPILRFSCVSLFFGIIGDIPMKLLLRDLRYKSVGAAEFTSSLTASICTLVFAMKGYGAYSLVWGTIISAILKLCMACCLNPWTPRLIFQTRGLGHFMSFGGNLVASRILWYIYSNADYGILSKRLGTSAFGLYSFAVNFATIPVSKLQPILQPVFFSAFSKIQDDLPRLREEYIKIINVLFPIYATVYCGFFWISPEFVSIFLGQKWEPMIPVLRLLLLIQPLRAIYSGSPPLALVVGRPDVAAKTTLVFTCFMIPAFWVASAWGMEGVAIAWCCVYPFAMLISFSMQIRLVNISLWTLLKQFTSGVKFIIITSLVIGAFKYGLPHIYVFEDQVVHLWVQFLGTILVGIVSNAGVLWFLERQYIDQARTFMKK